MTACNIIKQNHVLSIQISRKSNPNMRNLETVCSVATEHVIGLRTFHGQSVVIEVSAIEKNADRASKKERKGP